jgi:phosphate transport system substrate-binding protein
MHKKPADASASKEALKFFAWTYDKGGDMAASLDYVPMPKNVVEIIKKEWAQIVGPDGKPLM